MTSKIIFGQMINYYRKKNNLTMEQLGKELGKAKSTISRWISGERYPKIEEIEEIANYFNTDVATLIFGERSATHEKTLLDIYNKLHTSRQQNVYHYAKEQLEEQDKEEEDQ